MRALTDYTNRTQLSIYETTMGVKGHRSLCREQREKRVPSQTPRRFLFRFPSILLLMLFTTGCGTFSTLPDSYHPSNAIDPSSFNHQIFDELMKRHVEDGTVNYPGIQKDLRLEAYLRQVNRLNPNTLPSKNDRLAFWINTYNAFAIKGILNGYSPSTKLGQYTYFVGEEYMVGQEEINLWSIERDILIPRFKEPRIHFAIVCASRSCPKLRSFAFIPDQLDQQLDDSARKFINDPTRNRFDRKKKIAYLSMIFEWFSEDFEGHSGSVLNYISQFVDDPDLARELREETYSIEHLEYDWNLNGTPPSQQASLEQGANNLLTYTESEQIQFLFNSPKG